MAEHTFKTCPDCSESKPLNEFGVYRTQSDGRNRLCRPCAASRQRRKRARNPERAREVTRKNVARWRAANYEKSRAATDAGAKAWKLANPERVRESRRVYYLANKERVAQQSREWVQANPDKIADKRLRRRARMVEAVVGEVDLAILWLRQCATCALCRERIDDSLIWPDPLSKSVDHIVPLSKGGTHEQSNLAWTHLVCNLKKGASLPTITEKPS